MPAPTDTVHDMTEPIEIRMLIRFLLALTMISILPRPAPTAKPIDDIYSCIVMDDG